MVRWLLVRFREDLALPDAVVPLDGRSGPSVPDILALLRAELSAQGVQGDPVAGFQTGVTNRYPTCLEEVRGRDPVVETRWHKVCAVYGYN